MKLLLAFALSLMLSACASTGTKMPTNAQVATNIEYACASASTANKVLAAANDAGKLSSDQQQQVLKANFAISPVCGAPDAPTLDSIKMAAFMKAVSLLQTAAAQSR